MDNLFRYDNKFFEVLGKISDIIILNLLCIISCLPIITIGASITATYSVALQMVKGEESYISREFIKRFKENLKFSTKVWVIMLVLGMVLSFDFYISRLINNEYVSMILQFGLTIISIIFIFSLSYVFPIISKFENTTKNTIINSILISIQHLPQTILIVLINLSPIILTFVFSNSWGQILFLYTVIGFGIIAYINSMFFNKIFKKYIV
ncbi:YesL family protein [Terrisporobacter sp.]